MWQFLIKATSWHSRRFRSRFQSLTATRASGAVAQTLFLYSVGEQPGNELVAEDPGNANYRDIASHLERNKHLPGMTVRLATCKC